MNETQNIQLTAIDMYDGEHIHHYLLCDIHLDVWRKESEYPWKICEWTGGGHKLDSDCVECVEENDR